MNGKARTRTTVTHANSTHPLGDVSSSLHAAG